MLDEITIMAIAFKYPVIDSMTSAARPPESISTAFRNKSGSRPHPHFKHLDRDDLIVGLVEIAVIHQRDGRTVFEPGTATLSRANSYCSRNGDGRHMRIIMLADIFGKAAPAAADFKQPALQGGVFRVGHRAGWSDHLHKSPRNRSCCHRATWRRNCCPDHSGRRYSRLHGCCGADGG